MGVTKPRENRSKKVPWGTKKWTKEELDTLRRIAPHLHKITLEELDALFPFRSLHGIRKKLSELGLLQEPKERINANLYKKLLERIEV